MDKIKIYSNDKTYSLELPTTRNISFTQKEISQETEMASGKLVKDIRGHRPVIVAEWDWFPSEKLIELLSLLRQGDYLFVQYPDPISGAAEGFFSISNPEVKIFKFVNGVAMWHSVVLTFTSQEVV